MERAAAVYTERGQTLGTAFCCDTLCRITVPRPDAVPAVEAAFRLCAELERRISRFAPGSDIDRLNIGEGPVPVSGDTLRLLTLAGVLSAMSEGALDVTALSPGGLADWRHLYLTEKTAERGPGQIVDPGAVGKGYILARAADCLRAEGVDSALLDFGGDLFCLGSRPSGEPWRVGIRCPDGSGRLFARLTCREEAVATSASDQRGQHILDPRSGKPAAALLSATVVDADAARADGLATACFVAGPEEGLALLDRAGAQGVLLDRQGRGRVTRGLVSRLEWNEQVF